MVGAPARTYGRRMNDYIGIKIVACHQDSMRAEAERERIAGTELLSVRIWRWAVDAVRAGLAGVGPQSLASSSRSSRS